MAKQVGYTAPDLAAHIKKYFNTDFINHAVVTHPDHDHAEGLAPILENYRVGALWMLRAASLPADRVG